MSTATTYQYLEPRPCSSYRQLFIKGTRIRAEIVGRAALLPPGHDEYRTPEQVAADWNLPVEAVEEAVRYCASNPVEIAYDHRREDLIIDAHGINHPDYYKDPKKHYML